MPTWTQVTNTDTCKSWKNEKGMLIQLRLLTDKTWHLYVPQGLPQIEYPEAVTLDTNALNMMFLDGRRLCYLCGDKDNIGVALHVCPSHITDEERAKQSDEAKAFNAAAAAAAVVSTATTTPSSLSAGDAVVAMPQTTKEQEYYNPYAKNPTPTDSVPPLDLNAMKLQNVRLVVDLVPCYVCVNCRRMGEAGSFAEKDGIHPSFPGGLSIPTPANRGLINKYCQRTGFTMRYRDVDGAYHPITDRLVLIRSDEEAKKYEINLFQQMGLLVTPWDCNVLNTMKGKNDTRFQTTLATYFRQTIPPLLRAAAKLMVKGGKTEVREMQAFEPSYEYSMIFIRAALHMLQNYPQTREELVRSVYRWSYNPFSKDAKELFQNWMDPLWVAALCGIPFSHIREPLTLFLFHIMALGYNPTDDKMQKTDMKTYLRRVFNEGRSNNTLREFLYATAFAGMIQKEIATRGISGLISLMNQHSCYLPDEEYLKTVWREMSYINDNIISLIPEDGKPGLFRHLGMGDPNADTAQTTEHVFKFLNYARQYGLVMHDVPVPLDVINKICATSFNLSTPVITSAVQRHDMLAQQEQTRLKLLKDIHTGPLPLDPINGAHRLSELRCAFPRCGRGFKSQGALKSHLKEAWNIDPSDPKFSLNELHRRACGNAAVFDSDRVGITNGLDHCVLRRDMTPALVMGLGLTQCPVNICPAHTQTMTPIDLCNHFASLGVAPFWTPGWTPPVTVNTSLSAAASSSSDDKKVEKEKQLACIFDNPGMCIACQDAPCSVILLPCGHINMCGTCKDQWCTSGRACPTCRTAITMNITFAAFKASPDKDNVKVFSAGSTD